MPYKFRILTYMSADKSAKWPRSFISNFLVTLLLKGVEKCFLVRIVYTKELCSSSLMTSDQFVTTTCIYLLSTFDLLYLSLADLCWETNTPDTHVLFKRAWWPPKYTIWYDRLLTVSGCDLNSFSDVNVFRIGIDLKSRIQWCADV